MRNGDATKSVASPLLATSRWGSSELLLVPQVVIDDQIRPVGPEGNNSNVDQGKNTT